MLERARHLHAIRDDNESYTLSVPLALVRRAALRLGQRLADRGRIDAPDDVFLLTVDEARAAHADGTDMRPTVDRSRKQQAWVHAHPGPAAYGPEPPPPPSLSRVPAPLRTVNAALSWYVDLSQALPGTAGRRPTTGIVHGIPASPGLHTGPVRVILDEDSLHTVRPGDVVVCTTTSPVWSVLFPSIGALVTDVGGVLSHPAIIAREFGTPAVVATGDATRQLTDGRVVTVNGSTGTVEPI